MALKRYVCHTHPGLRIGSEVKFNMGYFQTDKEFLQRKIESNDLWGARIFEIPAPRDVDLPAPKNPEMLAAVDAAMSGRELVDIDLENFEEDTGPAEQQQDDRPWTEKLSASEINRMTVSDLDALISELGVEVEEGSNAIKKKRAIRLKLGV